ncbi:hypothetical protein AFCA_011751 [Aspergillus flavus]|nr:hypothetical protein AFCA_011751 [Aspergillus flavus]
MADTEKPDVSDNKPHHHLNTDVEHSSGENQSAKEANDPNVVDFDGPTTQRTPINWSTANKTVAIAIVSMMTMLSMASQGDVVQVYNNVMHRDKDVWGEDADEFKSERWFGLRPYWDFVPHSGGPRRYPAQLLVTTEASYVVARFCQRSKAVENRDVNGYIPIMRAGPVDSNGVKIAVTPV